MAWIIMCDPQNYIIDSLFIVDNLHCLNGMYLW
jgi:hypothetical protein